MADRSLLIQMIRAEALRQGVDPALALAVVQSESGFRPEVRGDDGQSQGLFQLRPAAAKDAGIDPANRLEPATNIRGGISYLKMQLDKERGNEERALTRYNTGTPTYRGIGTPGYAQHVLQQKAGFARHEPGTPRKPQTQGTSADIRARLPERPSLSQRLATWLSPASAEAQGAPVAPGAIDWKREFGVTDTPAAAAPAAHPAAPPTQAPAQEQREGIDWHQELLGTPRPAAPMTKGDRAAHELTRLQQEEQQRLSGTGLTGTAPMVGELAGQYAGTALLGPGIGTAVGGALGAGSGQVVENVLQGEPINWRKAASEAVFSALPEAGESVLRSGFTRWLRSLPGGQTLRFDEAARRARALPEQVFTPAEREAIGEQFEAVRRSGVHLDTGAIAQELRSLRPGKYADVMSEIRRIDRDYKTGGRYQQLLQNLRQPGAGVRVSAMPIGDLQQLRSALRQRIDQLEHTEARQLLRDVQRSVDTAIDQGMARGRVGAGQTVEQLQEARRQWARLRASEDLGDLVERTITTTPDLQMARFNMRQFADALRRNTSDLAQNINRALDQTPGARARFMQEAEEIARLYQTIELPLADVAGFRRMPLVAGISQAMSRWMVHNPALFREAVVNGRGRLAPNAVAVGVNAARRDAGLEPVVLPWMAEAEPAESGPPAQAGGALPR